MSLEQLWAIYTEKGYSAVEAVPLGDALDRFYRALLAFGEQAFEQAALYCRQAADLEPDNLVFAQAATFLGRVVCEGRQDVYLSAEGFAAFIRGGGNVALYRATSAALKNVYLRSATISLLDIGVGDGLALLPALTDNIRQLDLLEPSQAMLANVSSALNERRVKHRAIEATLQAFAREHGGRWDLVQATFSLQSIPTEERLPLLKWLRDHADRLLVAEFDVPSFAGMYAPERVRYIVERYQQGLAEYAEDQELVAQSFLMPVMLGYFDRTAQRTNYEQSLEEWVAQLREAGFKTVHATLLFPYWWAPVYLIDAR